MLVPAATTSWTKGFRWCGFGALQLYRKIAYNKVWSTKHFSSEQQIGATNWWLPLNLLVSLVMTSLVINMWDATFHILRCIYILYIHDCDATWRKTDTSFRPKFSNTIESFNDWFSKAPQVPLPTTVEVVEWRLGVQKSWLWIGSAPVHAEQEHGRFHSFIRQYEPC